jgi:uncharacterized membrane protein
MRSNGFALMLLAIFGLLSFAATNAGAGMGALQPDLPQFHSVRYYPESGDSRPPGLKGQVAAWLYAHPFFKRHPHPLTVHFPVALLLAAVLFQVLALATSSSRTEWAAYCCLLVGALSIPVSLATGYFTWWINYANLESPIIFLKRFLAWIALVLAVFAVLLRSLVIEDPLQRRDAYNLIYFLTLLILAGLVAAVGYLGGTIAFPY